jgi:hypothetical protein
VQEVYIGEWWAVKYYRAYIVACMYSKYLNSLIWGGAIDLGTNNNAITTMPYPQSAFNAY